MKSRSTISITATSLKGSLESIAEPPPAVAAIRRRMKLAPALRHLAPSLTGVVMNHAWLVAAALAIEAVTGAVQYGPDALMDWADAWRYVRNPRRNRTRPDRR